MGTISIIIIGKHYDLSRVFKVISSVKKKCKHVKWLNMQACLVSKLRLWVEPLPGKQTRLTLGQVPARATMIVSRSASQAKHRQELWVCIFVLMHELYFPAKQTKLHVFSIPLE